jgi:hypothetical protein
MAANQDRIYEDLKRQYDLIADRRKTLTSQATNITVFVGIIETILIATIVSAVTDPDARSLLRSSILYYPVLAVAGIGFGSYILTIIFSLKAYWEPKWVPAPQIPLAPGKDRFQSIDYFWGTLAHYNVKRLAQQLGAGMDSNQEVNDLKYDNLHKAFWWLKVGIIATGIGGLFFLIMAV